MGLLPSPTTNRPCQRYCDHLIRFKEHPLINFLTSGLQQNQTVEYKAEIFSFNSRGRSEVVKLPKITLNAEETVSALTVTMLGNDKLYFSASWLAGWLLVKYIKLSRETVFKGF